MSSCNSKYPPSLFPFLFSFTSFLSSDIQLLSKPYQKVIIDMTINLFVNRGSMIHKFSVCVQNGGSFFFCCCCCCCKVETFLFLELQISLLSLLFVIVYNKYLDAQSFQTIHSSKITKIMNDVHFANMRKLECGEI